MKNFISITLLTLIPVLSFASELTDKLNKIKTIKSMTELKSDHYTEKYTVMFEQPVDWSDPKAGKFQHRVILMHRGFDRPTVMITEGYGASYALPAGFENEIAKHLNANLIFVEHRYFLESTPQPRNWKYLTVKNSMDDLHDIRTLLGEIYPRKWLATGISKGGSTTMYYRAFYPNDIDVSVPYVGPMNTGVQDGRHEIFLQNVGTPLQRKAVRDFQIECLKRKTRLLPLFDKFCDEKGYLFKAENKIIFDYVVLEYAFSLWQWGNPVHKIPSLTASDSEIFDYLMAQCDPQYFAAPEQNSTLSFFVQAAKELGYYGYDILPFTEWLDVKSTKNYLSELFMPKELEDVKYDGTANIKTLNFLKENDVPMIFIYGENDPWSATGICQWLDFSTKKNMHLFVDPIGSHLSRIQTLPPTLRSEAWELIDNWMK